MKTTDEQAADMLHQLANRNWEVSQLREAIEEAILLIATGRSDEAMTKLKEIL